jgi:uncharacterized protein YdaU (DUF1376 family)
MPLYVSDFIADTEHLSATETGIYIRLIMHCWQHGSIPKDEHKLSLIAHLNPKLWRAYRHLLSEHFTSVDASSMTHKRVLSELLRYREISNKRKEGALQKQLKRQANDMQVHTHARARQLPSKKDSLLDRAEEQQNYPTGESTFLTMRGVASRGVGAAPGGAPPPRPPQPKPNGNGAHLQASSELVAIMRRNGHAREKGLGDE